VIICPSAAYDDIKDTVWYLGCIEVIGKGIF
jgi:hypothetical protein